MNNIICMIAPDVLCANCLILSTLAFINLSIRVV